MKSNKNTGRFSAKGYYIALILCAAAIGISGYLYYRNANETNSQLQNGVSDSTVGSPNGDDVQAVAPDKGGNSVTQATVPDALDESKPTQSKVFKTGLPLSGETVADYAMECLAYNETTRDWRTHNGIDIAAEAGSVVCAAAEGTVYNVYEDDTMGTTVVIRHENGYVTVYSSLAEDVPVKAGDAVKLGQTIGAVSNSSMLESAIGDHLHFSVTCNGEAVDPQDFFALS